MFHIYPNPNSYANPNPNPLMSDYYIQDCRIGLLAGGCSHMVSRVRVSIKAMVMDQCSKECGMDIAYPWLSNWTCLQ